MHCWSGDILVHMLRTILTLWRCACLVYSRRILFLKQPATKPGGHKHHNKLVSCMRVSLQSLVFFYTLLLFFYYFRIKGLMILTKHGCTEYHLIPRVHETFCVYSLRLCLHVSLVTIMSCLDIQHTVLRLTLPYNQKTTTETVATISTPLPQQQYWNYHTGLWTHALYPISYI